MERGNRIFRIIDRYLGVVIVLGLLPFFKRHRSRPKTMDSIAVLMFGAIGDTLLLIPVLVALQKTGKRVAIVCSKSNYEICKRYGFNTILFDLARVFQNPTLLFRYALDIRKRHFDLILDFNPWARMSAIFSALGNAEFTMGFRTHGQHRHHLYDYSVDHSGTVHETENYLSLAKSILGEEEIAQPFFEVTIDENKGARNLIRKINLENQDYCVLHPWGGGYKGELREWPMRNSVALVRELLKLGLGVIITGANNDSERALELANLSGAQTIAGLARLGITAAVIRGATFLVCVNTGIMHLGAALGVGIVALHGPTNPVRWGPLSKRAVVLAARLRCVPCLDLGFEYKCGTAECMKSLQVSEVLEACKGFLRPKGT